MKLKKSAIYLSGLLLILTFSVFLLFQNKRVINLNSILKINIFSLEEKSNPKKKFSSYPEFSAVDILGNKINPSTLKGRNVFIQFINPKLREQVNLLKRIYFEFNEQELSIVIFTKDFKTLKKEIRYAFGSIFVITKGYEKLANKWNKLIKEFREKDLNNIVFLIDKKGQILRVMDPNNQEEFFNY